MSEFRSDWSEDTFKRKYALFPEETWHQRAQAVVDYVCGTAGGTEQVLLDKDTRDYLVQCIREFKFMPGGRYLYYAGRRAKFYNNCFSGDTKILTTQGYERFDSLVGQEFYGFSPVEGEFVPMTMYDHGVQPAQEVTFVPVRGRSEVTYRVVVTPDHKWPLVGGGFTENLREGDTVPANTFSVGHDPEGFAHGFVYGDGNANGQLRLCCEKDVAYLDRLKSVDCTVSYPSFADGDPVLYFPWLNGGSGKELPSDDESPEYIASFIEGWLAADGSKDRILCSVNKEALLWFRRHAAYAGLVMSGELRSQVRDVKIGEYEYKDHEIFIQNYSRGSAWSGFKVSRIVPVGKTRVYCPFEPMHNRIVIDHGIDTYQCYLLRAEEDTREEWAALAQRVTSCLMTGGGIGVDYSILRAAGEPLSRTGGISSGPIPLMHIVNEIGRNVMQGGSRRSAIYASLDWDHADAGQFLLSKNWDQAVRDLKEQDFNFPAPLDMTNVSLNYNDAWLNMPGREQHPTFIRNVRQALKTGEPGFSFNFGEKQNETLRNACTEVTSEDDSDVCNLGSVNLGRVDNIEELRDVVEAASKFLVCGTLRADLPYGKVSEVREKNRRLGLGLMGIHEWLLKRNKKYEVDDELREWLTTYRDTSESSANEHCDRFYLSRPKGYRAIAPTGTIGILAGTTTGIEPLYAVAYKRRYLTDGTRWKYQFVVDQVAEHLIEEYGIEPDKIDTALDLAEDVERRIAFQADVQDYVDMAISSTINLPAWGSDGNNEDNVGVFSTTLSQYAPRLRGFTCYPDGSRGGQPLTVVPYEDAMGKKNVEFTEHDVCELTGHGGTCGV